MFQGINLHMIDTAGIRNTEDTVEKIGVQKSIDHIEDADLVLYVVDSSVPLSEEDMDIMNLVKNRKCIVLLNKNDLEQIVSENVIREMFSKGTLKPTDSKQEIKDGIIGIEQIKIEDK